MNLRRRRKEEYRTTTVDLASRSFSPALLVLNKYCDLFFGDHDNHWDLLRALGQWTVETRSFIRKHSLLCAAGIAEIVRVLFS